MVHPFTGLKLWEYFKFQSGANHEQVSLVEKLVDYALPLLEKYSVAFPAYTLHNQRHQANVIDLMGQLLGDDLKRSSALECAILILSAVYHDIGMIYTPDELESVINEESFDKFLHENVSAKLAFEETGRLPSDALIEWYCRWNHAERVWIFLNEIDRTIAFKWEQHPFKKQLGMVCQSHNQSLDEILVNKNDFNENFFGCCDLKFCAILLRLADILDFDNTRTPVSVYEYLDLHHPKTGAEAVSRDEWAKHLHSQGFDFVRKPGNISLLFKASPPHPFIELGIRNFLQIIESELENCARSLQHVSARWRDFLLPDGINTDNIQSENYKSGDYHFSLDENRILDLLTGEGLYNDDFVFLRELLQNAIDTTRHREFSERLNNANFRVEPIRVSFFTDAEGYQWVTVDDYGMGMNEDIIVKHLLKKGNSYYASDKFKLDVLEIKNKLRQDFRPISRFGIGLLSCFIIGDRIEINTKYKHSGLGGDSYRLSIEGRNNLFIIQSKLQRHSPIRMPAAAGMDLKADYRKDFGTSVAVRLKSDREQLRENIEKKLREYLICPPAPIIFDGKMIGGDAKIVLEEAWCGPQLIKVNRDFVKDVEKRIGISLVKGIELEIKPINIMRDSPDPDLKGQLVVINVSIKDLKDKEGKWKGHFFFKEADNPAIDKSIFLCFSSDKYSYETDLETEISLLLSPRQIKLPEVLTSGNGVFPFNKLLLSHNGITVRGGEKFNINCWDMNQYLNPGGTRPSLIYAGVIALKDRLLPEVTVSRNEIKSLNFSILSSVLFALRELNNYIGEESEFFGFLGFSENDYEHGFSILDIRQSHVYENGKDYWDKSFYLEKGFRKDEKKYTINDLKSIIHTDGGFNLPFVHSEFGKRNFFCRSLLKYIIAENFGIRLVFSHSEDTAPELSLVEKTASEWSMESDFEPLLFVEFVHMPVLLIYQNPMHRFINKQHPLIQWLEICYNNIPKQFQSYAIQMINVLSARNIESPDRVRYLNNILRKLTKTLPLRMVPPAHLEIIEDDFLIV